MINNKAQTIPLFVFISWLKQSKKIDSISSVFTIASMVLLFVPSQALIIVIVVFLFLAGIVEKYYAFRVNFDIELFKQLPHKDPFLSDTLEIMDEGLAQLKLIKNNQTTLRSLASRQQGARSLFKKQCYFCAIQLLLFIVLFIMYQCY